MFINRFKPLHGVFINHLRGRPMVFLYHALDDFGEPFKRFKSKTEANWFQEINPGVVIQSTGYKPEKIPVIDPYQQALADCGQASF